VHAPRRGSWTDAPARERKGRMTPETAYDMDMTPEYALLLAIIRRAHGDLHDHTPPHERARSIEFFNVSSLPIMEKGEQFLRVIGIFTFYVATIKLVYNENIS